MRDLFAVANLLVNILIVNFYVRDKYL